MAALNEAPIYQRGRRTMGRIRKHVLKPDKTPMVGLGFLLIAFFVVTTEISKPKVANLNMPADENSTELGNSYSLTVLLGKGNSVYYYEGAWEAAKKENRIFQTTMDLKTGLGRAIRDKQQSLDKIKPRPSSEGREGLMILIKPSNEASYNTIIDVLDEILINRVEKYALVNLTTEEQTFIR